MINQDQKHILKKQSFKIFLSLVAAFVFLSGCGGEEEVIDASLVGTWILQEEVVSSPPEILTFFNDGHYLIYSKCDDLGSEETEPLEIGTYTHSGNLLIISGHIQNGCGGFDDDENGGIPAGPIEISFSDGGERFTIGNSAEFERVANDAFPIVGSWNLPGGFNPDKPHFITFLITSDYFVYADCEETEAGSGGEPLEIGSYHYEGNVLTIHSHYQNGCGGFDSDEVEGQPAGDINVSFSEDGNKLTLVDAGLTLTRVR
jgi:hypothetical protein